METGKRTDPAFAAEAKALTDRVHDLLRSAQDDGGPLDTIQLKVPRAWIVLAAWMRLVERERAGGRVGSVPVPVFDLDERMLRKLAKRWLRSHIEAEMHLHLHYLGVGNHPLLLPSSAEMPELNQPANDVPSEEDLPF